MRWDSNYSWYSPTRLQIYLWRVWQRLQIENKNNSCLYVILLLPFCSSLISIPSHLFFTLLTSHIHRRSTWLFPFLMFSCKDAEARIDNGKPYYRRGFLCCTFSRQIRCRVASSCCKICNCLQLNTLAAQEMPTLLLSVQARTFLLFKPFEQQFMLWLTSLGKNPKDNLHPGWPWFPQVRRSHIDLSWLHFWHLL